jgi:hypothetical protein
MKGTLFIYCAVCESIEDPLKHRQKTKIFFSSGTLKKYLNSVFYHFDLNTIEQVSL